MLGSLNINQDAHKGIQREYEINFFGYLEIKTSRDGKNFFDKGQDFIY